MTTARPIAPAVSWRANTPMSGMMALLGSGEYLDGMNAVDRRLLAGSGARVPRVACVPTAAVPRGRACVEHYARLGLEHFRRLGADVEAVLISDRAAANDDRWIEVLSRADLIYFSGGSPIFLYRALARTRAWEAVQAARLRGASLAGCSAGAMVLGERLALRARRLNLAPAFGLIPDCVVVPHFNRRWVRHLSVAIVDNLLTGRRYALGIDEDTALIGRLGGTWEVMGAGSVSVATRRAVRSYPAGGQVALPPAMEEGVPAESNQSPV